MAAALNELLGDTDARSLTPGRTSGFLRSSAQSTEALRELMKHAFEAENGAKQKKNSSILLWSVAWSDSKKIETTPDAIHRIGRNVAAPRPMLWMAVSLKDGGTSCLIVIIKVAAPTRR